MSENTTMIPAASEEYEAFLPDGWAEGDDIFDVASWTGGKASADESETAEDQEEVTEVVEGAEDALAIEQAEGSEESTDDGAEAPAIEQTPDRPRLKFSAQIDHKMEDVELDETELPTIYQKAHVTDRVRAKLEKMRPVLDKGNRLAKILGYDSIDAMLDSAESSYKQGEIDRLTGEGVHPDVAKELVDSRTQRAISDAPAAEEESPEEETPATRDYRSEVADLLKAHPELRGTQLPPEVVNACVVQGRPLVGAYEEHIRRKAEAEAKAVKAENKRLKQNADAASRAPVRGVSKGGKTNLEPDDPFLIGFNSDRW